MKHGYTIAFACGAVLVGGLDLAFTIFGAQRYLIDVLGVGPWRWPIFVPVQMGLAAMLALFAWDRAARALRLDGDRPVALPIAIAGVAVSLGLQLALLESSWRVSIYALLGAASVAAVALTSGRRAVIAYTLVGIAGSAAEWILLDPRIGYWEFTNRDLFDRLPAWEPVAYGWIGVAVDTLSRRKS